MPEKTIPAFPNHYPYNELLLSGKLSVKTRKWRWNHTGLTLLYTSTSTAPKDVLECHDLLEEAKTAPRMVLVGVGELQPVRKMTGEEGRKFVSQIYSYDFVSTMMPNIGAGTYRYEFKGLRRFKKPVPFKAPQGAVRLFDVPVSVVAKALKEVGIDPLKI